MPTGLGSKRPLKFISKPAQATKPTAKAKDALHSRSNSRPVNKDVKLNHPSTEKSFFMTGIADDISVILQTQNEDEATP